MRRPRIILLSLLVLSSLTITLGVDVVDCGLYLGESTIKNAGWGVFAGRSFKVGDEVGPPSIGIQVFDPEKIVDRGPIHDYLWRSSITGGTNEADRVRSFLPGVGSLANYHPFKYNVVEGGLHYANLFDRNADPQAGANTAYHNFTFIATTDINPGDEIFIGASELGKEHPRYSAFPTWEDYSRASKIIDDLVLLHRKHPELSQTQWIDILYRVKTEMVEDVDKAIGLLPDSLEQLLEIKTKGLTSFGLITRNFDDIRKGGLCLDSIREGPSTIPGAGRGAFATKVMPKGSLISPVPLLQIMDSGALHSTRNPGSNSSHQLLLNYCFGHDRSKMVLCPLSHAVLLNHKSGSANAELRWGKPSSNRGDDENALLGPSERLHVDPNDFINSCSKLTLELFATENLMPGDEILLDYGSSWEIAHAEHIRNWTPINDGFIPASTKNKEKWPIIADSWSNYECRLEPKVVERRAWISTESYLSYIEHDPSRWPMDVQKTFGTNPNVAWFPCDVFGFDKQGVYEAKVYSKSLDEARIIKVFHSMPRDAIRFVDKPYHSDQHLSHSFRNFIPFPDKLFPLRWRDDYLNATFFHLGSINLGVDANAAENYQERHDHEQRLRAAKCGLYFAPSNIPAAGFSSYTAVPYFARGIAVGMEMSAIVIPFANKTQALISWDIMNYVWNSKSNNAEYEMNDKADMVAVSLANYHPGLVNMHVAPSKFEPVLDSCKDPGAGAFSDYVRCAFLSQQVLQPGEELFISYGESWFTSRAAFKDVPLSRNYKDANRLVSSLMALMKTNGFGSGSAIAVDILHTVKNSIINEHRTSMAMAKLESPTHIEEAIARNGTAKHSVTLRTQAWFEEHGQCMDHVYYNHSTIPQAGKGAFTRRPLQRGSTIISSPLILTWGDKHLTMKGDLIPKGINSRLILENYMFKHPSADVYFLPITPVTVINHGSPRPGSSNPPNAQIQWSQWDRRSNYFLQRPIDDLRKEHFSTMVFDVVALRDISVDEEILIDYGEEWEKAWANHVKNFVSPCRGHTKPKYSSLAVYKMNLDKFKRTFHEWSKGHFTVCPESVNRNEGDHQLIFLSSETAQVVSGTGEHIVIDTSYRGIKWDDEGFDLIQETGRVPCKIISAFPERNEFDVAYFRSPTVIVEGLTVATLQIHTGLPASEIEFIHKPFMSDMHNPGAFRHPIKIPDDIFPAHWRNSLQ